MEFSIRRVNALFKKEIKDFGKNMNVFVMCFFPIMICALYSKILGGNLDHNLMVNINILTLSLGTNLVMVGSYLIAMLIAEEKEKNTLRTLMLSAVSPWEFLAGKALITLLVTEIINVILFFMIGMNIQYLGKYMLLSTLVVLSMIEIGAIIGILSSNQMATGVVSMPVLIVFYMLPLIAKINKTIGRISELLPNYNMNIMLEKVFKGESIGVESTYNICIILVWILIGAALFMYAYNKKGLDK